MGPETPLTRIREIMTDKLPLYQLAAECAKVQQNSKDSERLKRESELGDARMLEDPKVD